MKGLEIGRLQQFEGLAFVEVFEAGHLVPVDKPEESLFLVDSWLARLHRYKP